MKEKILLISFPVLLLVSSGILSQPETEQQGPLMLATVNTGALNSRNELRDDLQIDKPLTRNITDSDTAIDNRVESQPAEHSDDELAQLRQLFLQAENALKKKDDVSYFLLADQLKDYPLYPYLQYQWLKKHLDQEIQVKNFLQQHASSRYASKLKRKWLLHLGKHKQWPLLLENKITTKDTTLGCYFHRAELNAGDKSAALAGAQQLWAVGHSQPRVCDPLFSQLKKSVLFTQYLRWKRFDAALKNNKVSLAKYVRTLMQQNGLMEKTMIVMAT